MARREQTDEDDNNFWKSPVKQTDQISFNKGGEGLTQASREQEAKKHHGGGAISLEEVRRANAAR